MKKARWIVAAVRAAAPDEQRRVYALLDTILPVSPRAKGLLNEGAVAQALRPLPLERIAVPALIATAEDDGYRTFPGAKYTADRIPGARFLSYAQGGHMLVGHEAEFRAEVLKFLGAANVGVQ